MEQKTSLSQTPAIQQKQDIQQASDVQQILDSQRASIRRITRVSLLAAMALLLSYLETMFPLPFLPGIKLGLANIAVLVALYVCDTKSAAEVALVKVLAAGFLFGSPMMLAYSFAGTVLAFFAMATLAKVPSLSVTFISMVAAILHNAGQLFIAAIVLQTPAVFLLNFPVLAIAACVTGAITGVIATALVKEFAK